MLVSLDVQTRRLFRLHAKLGTYLKSRKDVLVMKKIEAIVRHHKVEDVKEALVSLGLHGMTLTEVRGFGRQRGHTETYRGTEYRIDFVPKVKVEIVVSDDVLDKTVAALIAAAKTGQVGDGKIFVSDLAEVIRVRTGETGAAAI
jgi:nitrogen regulatory protein P-II 1